MVRAVPFLVLAVLASACAGSGGGTAKPATSANSSTAGGADAQLLGDAEKDGQVTWYSVLPPTSVDAVEKAFKERYPKVKLDTVRLSSGPASTRYSQERAAGTVGADIVTISNPPFFRTGQEKGWFEKSPSLPALASWPKDYYHDGEATTGLLPLLLGYNKSRVQSGQLPKQWRDLAAPQWKGQILLGDPRTVPAYLALIELWRQDYGDQFLAQIAQQQPTLVPSIVPGAQQLAAGSASLMVPSSATVLNPLIKKGAQLDNATISPTTGVEYVTAISAGARKPAAARLLMNFLLTREGQAAFNTAGGTSVLGQVAPDTVPLPPNYRPLAPLVESATQHQADIARLLNLH